MRAQVVTQVNTSGRYRLNTVDAVCIDQTFPMHTPIGQISCLKNILLSRSDQLCNLHQIAVLNKVSTLETLLKLSFKSFCLDKLVKS
jgi:hypothetical protein